MSEHGRTGYVHHRCRCDVCRAANSEYARVLRQKRRDLPPERIPHGINGSVNYGCRCDICTSALSVRNKRYAALPIQGEAHGTWANYRKGCRCDPCAELAREHSRKPTSRRAQGRLARRRNEESIPRAANRGKLWTSAEIETAMRSDLSLRALARVLGRTVDAVRTKRGQLGVDPATRFLAGLAPMPEPRRAYPRRSRVENAVR